MDKTAAKWKHGSDIVFTSPQRLVNTIFLHCSASDVASHDDISVMKRWHMVDNGWSRVGYHFFINKNGDIQEGCPIEQIPIAQKGHNTGSIAICLHGLKKAKFTKAQLESVIKLCKAITGSYDKKIRIRGHKEVSAKSCPVFDYKQTLGLNDEGYYKDDKAASTSAVVSPIAAEVSESDTSTVTITRKVKPIRLFSKGAAVTALQGLLKKLGFPCAIDGEFGQNTVVSAKAFQKKKGLTADGIVGAKSIDAMFSTKNLILKKMNKGIDVEVLQLLLAMCGKSVMHDGVFGLSTETALKNQQELLELKSDGVFGPISRKIMLS